MSYNVPLDPSGDVDFAGTMTASFFVGDGSQLTNLPSAINGIDETGDYTWTGNHTFNGGFNAVDGDFSGNLSADMNGFVLNLNGEEGDTDRVYTKFDGYSDASTGTVSVWSRLHTEGAYLNTGAYKTQYRIGINGSWNILIDNVGLFAQINGSLQGGFWDRSSEGNGKAFFSVNYDLGSLDWRWVKAYLVDTSFTGDMTGEVGSSYKLYNLGEEGDTDTEYLETSWDTNVLKIFNKATGSGTARNLEFGSTNCQFNIKPAADQAVIRTGGTARFVVENTNTQIWNTTNFYPNTTSVTNLGTATYRWLNIYSVGANFSGTVTANAFVGDGSQLTNLPSGGGSVDTGDDFTWTGDHVFEGSVNLNTLVTEIGGSYKLYNLGSEGDADTEYLDISATANEFFISPKVTGTGTRRDLFVTGAYSSTRAHLEFQDNGNLKIAYGSNANILVGSGYVKFRANVDPNVNNTYTMGTSSIKWSTGYFYTLDAQTTVKSNSWEGRGFANMFIQNPDDFPIYVKHNNNNSYIISSSELSPMSNNSKDCGSTTNRWSSVNSVDGDFSGDVVMAANVDFTNLPTSDPNTAGRLYNDSGTVKISSGGGGAPPP